MSNISRVAEIVAALRAAPTAGELKTERAYRQLFDTVNAQPERHWQAALRPPGRSDRTVAVGARAALVAAVAVAAVGATAAAYAGSLPEDAGCGPGRCAPWATHAGRPDRLQRSAHRLIGAPGPIQTNVPQ
jgi:hypothetical protein